MTTLVTGVAGFIGFSLCRHLLERNDLVVGLDTLHNDSSLALKHSRLQILQQYPHFKWVDADIRDAQAINDITKTYKNDLTSAILLAAIAGVRDSFERPAEYVSVNISGFVVLLEALRRLPRIEHLVYASSSSVYGHSTEPQAVHRSLERPLSPYGASKLANELMAWTHSPICPFPLTGLRFFTVYGPWMRHDMAMSKFAHAILNGEPLRLFNYGRLERDFIYIDDVVAGIVAVHDRFRGGRDSQDDPSQNNQNDLSSNPHSTPQHDPTPKNTPRLAHNDPENHRVYNIGTGRRIGIETMVDLLEKGFGRKAHITREPLGYGEALLTWADITPMQQELGFVPRVDFEQGIEHFVDWYRRYYQYTV